MDPKELYEQRQKASKKELASYVKLRTEICKRDLISFKSS
jgi:hypothetical protein